MQNIGIFLNNTNSDENVETNFHNYNILKNNFEKIIIIDIDNIFSKRLKKIINESNNIYIYVTENCFIKKNLSDLNINSILYLFNIYDKKIECNYLTFISDNYIYCDNLEDYFEYINEHDLDFYSYTDSSQKKYHYQLYFFSISYKSLNSFKSFIINNKDNDDIEFNLPKIFDNKMPFLKIAYLDDNISNNIFYNYKLYKNLVITKLLPIININYLYHCKINFNVIIHSAIPVNFDIEIYKNYEDLKDKTDLFLYNHFLLYGQFENRNYSEDGNSILPNFIRHILESFDLLYFFDVPDDFDRNSYRKKNKDINKLSDTELYLHWINFGKNENRSY
jgi:hypothetical protein